MRTVRDSVILLAYSCKDLYFSDNKHAWDSVVQPARKSPVSVVENEGRASEFILLLSLGLIAWNSFFSNL